MSKIKRMKMKNINVKIAMGITLMLAICTLNVDAQNKTQRKAEEAFEKGEYSDVIKLNQELYESAKTEAEKVEILFMIAESYRMLRNPKSAAAFYEKVIANKYPNPVIYLYYGDALRMIRRFDESIISYEKYLKLVPVDSRADIGTKSCKVAREWMANPSRYEVLNKAFFNSGSMDYSTAYGKKDFSVVLFTTSRDEASGNEVQKILGQGFADIFMSVKDKKDKWSIPVPLSGDVNTEHDEGTPSVNQKGNTLYFTRCTVEKGKICGCQIYSARKMGLGFADAQKINIAADTLSVGYPSISADDCTLYFAAKLPGGFGDSDIWMIKRSSPTKPWGEAVNLGSEINTPGCETAPYIRADGTLFFSSDYHIGMGGLDIFEASKGRTGNWKVVNLKYPINSTSDDFGICFETNNLQGYLSSTREGGKGFEDIYYFRMPPLQFRLEAFVQNETTSEEIADAIFRLFKTDTSKTLVGTNISEINGSTQFDLEVNSDYLIEVSKESYLSRTASLSTKNIETDSLFKKYLYLTSTKSPITIENIFFEFNSDVLTSESSGSLLKLVTTLNENPKIRIQINSHADHIGEAQANDTLSQRRAEAVVKFLVGQGIVAGRLSAKGYGESVPVIVTKEQAGKYNFLNVGDKLSEKFVLGLKEDQQEAARELNRRTEFTVVDQNYSSIESSPPK